jgi:hypothetical protein
MAETKQEKQTFKWGDSEYLLDDLLKLHAEQEQNFYNFARAKGSYDDAALAGLRSALTNRINAVKSGKAFSADGVLDTDTVDNTSIQTQKKGLFKKEKYVEQDNTEWAKYYLNKLVGQLKPHQREDTTSSKDWDISKHGFEAYLKGQGLDARDVFEKYDLRDENNPDAARSYTQRDEQLRKHLGNYKTWLESKGFDFTKNDNEWDDNYMSTLDSVINGDWTDRTALAASLRKLGSGNYALAFTSDRWDLSKSDEELTEEAKKAEADKKAKENVGAYNNAVGNYYGIYSGLSPKTGQMTAYLGQSNSSFYRTPEELLDWAKTNKATIDSYQKRYDENKWDVEAAQYILPMMQTNGRLVEATIDGTKYVYDPNTINRTNHSFIAINPTTGFMEQRFLYDLENEMTALRNKYLKPQGASKYQIDVESHKEGGIISMQTGGNFDATAYLQSLSDADYKKRSSEKGVDERVLREAERTPMGEKTVINNSGLTGNDYVQLTTMAANLGTIFLDPISGGISGAGLSTVDFINDISRDGFQWKDVGNYVKNLGMDAIGMLPVIGDTFGTLGKVKKGLFQLAPKIIGYLGMAQGIANSPQIIDSFSKILDDRDMTTTDWQNIANGINLIVSGSRVGKHAVKNSRAKKVSIEPDKLQVEVTDKAGNTKLLILDGENAKAIKNSDHSVESVNKIIKDIEGMQDYEVSAQSNIFDFSLKMPGRKVKNENTGKEERVWKPYESKTQMAAVSEVYDPIKYARAYNSGRPSTTASLRMLRSKNIVDASGKQNLEQFKKANQTLEDTNIQTMKDAAKAYAEAKVKNDKELGSVESGIKRATKIGEQYDNIEQTNQTIVTSNNALLGEITAIKNARSKLKTLQEEFDTIKESTSTTKQSDLKKKAEEIKKQKQLIEEKQKQLDDLKTKSGSASTVVAQQAVSNATNKISEVNVQRAKLQDLLNRLGSRQSTLSTSYTSNSPEFDALVNYRPKEVSFNGNIYKFGPETPFTREKLLEEGLYKQGGSINRNKINKFLSYAKR